MKKPKKKINKKHQFFYKEIKALREKIYTKEDIILFDEAEKCFSKKAYRASYILIWICIAESLREKIIELSLKDVEAGKVWGEIQKCEQQNQSPDKLIIDKSEELGLISKDEYKKLEHIRNLRNSYAHPTGTAPLIEEVVSAFHVS